MILVYKVVCDAQDWRIAVCLSNTAIKTFITSREQRLVQSTASQYASLRRGNSETVFSPIPMLTYGESLPYDNSLCNLIN